jgi:hypothetical protein
MRAAPESTVSQVAGLVLSHALRGKQSVGLKVSGSLGSLQLAERGEVGAL